jgi:hypothetical protein
LTGQFQTNMFLKRVQRCGGVAETAIKILWGKTLYIRLAGNDKPVEYNAFMRFYATLNLADIDSLVPKCLELPRIWISCP